MQASSHHARRHNFEFAQATLDANLFDVPDGYREVKDFASAFSADTTTNTNSEPAPTTQPAPATPATTTTPATDTNKKQENPVKKGLKSLKPKW